MIKSQDDLPTCNDGKRSSDVLLATVAKCERLQKQLDIAVKALEKYATKEGVVIEQRARDVIVDYHPFYDEGKLAKQALKQIKELNNN